MTAEAADHASAAPPTDADLEKILADLSRPLGQLLATLSSAGVQIMRTLLDQAYQRGRHDALLEATTSTLPPGLGLTYNLSGSSEPVLTAEQLDRLRRREGLNGGAF
jgi:hypothetical protein